MEINGVQPPGAPKPIEPAGNVTPARESVGPMESNDVVDISPAARLAADIQNIPDVRTELVHRVKAEIEAGTYESPERIEIAVNRLMDELLG